jgi:hypothetical protein
MISVMDRRQRPFVQIALGVALVLVCSSVGLTLMHFQNDLRAGTELAAGTVVDNVEAQDGYCAVIRFTDGEGHERTATVTHGQKEPLYDQGTKVAVLYDPANPGEVRIDSILGRYGLPVLFAVVGGFALAVFVVRPVRALRATAAAPGPSPVS